MALAVQVIIVMWDFVVVAVLDTEGKSYIVAVIVVDKGCKVAVAVTLAEVG